MGKINSVAQFVFLVTTWQVDECWKAPIRDWCEGLQYMRAGREAALFRDGRGFVSWTAEPVSGCGAGLPSLTENTELDHGVTQWYSQAQPQGNWSG